MSSIPLELPLRAGEAAALAGIVFDVCENRPLRDDMRFRIGARVTSERFESCEPCPGSLARDPVHQEAYFIAVDALAAGKRMPLLLRLALASAPATALFPNAILIARTRSGYQREFVINAIPFGPQDGERVRRFANEVDRAFLPRPHGAQPVVALVTDCPQTEVPAAFQAWRQALRTYGQNLACVTCAGGDPAPLVDIAIWSAIRAGWREGFAAALEVSLDDGIEAAKEQISRAALYSMFIVKGDLPGEKWQELRAFIAMQKLAQRSKQFDLDTAASKPRTVIEVTSAAEIGKAAARLRSGVPS